MEELIAGFLRFFLEEKAAAKNTIDAYGCDLRQFARFLERRPRRIALQDIDEGVITDYLEYMQRKDYSDSTLNRKFSALKSFFEYLVIEGMFRINPIEATVIPRRRVEFRPQSLTTKEIEALLEIPRRLGTKEAIRDLAMLELLWATGIRSTELVSLDVHMLNLDSEKPSVEVRKNGKKRIIPIPPHATRALERYLEKIRPTLISKKKEKALFVNLKGKRLTRQGFWLKLREYGRTAGLQGRISADTIRHSFAFQRLASDMPLPELQDLLGHATIHTTQKYQRVFQKIKVS